jgi:hypothetical protein
MLSYLMAKSSDWLRCSKAQRGGTQRAPYFTSSPERPKFGDDCSECLDVTFNGAAIARRTLPVALLLCQFERARFVEIVLYTAL